jgi:hypothetical protein
MKLLTILFGFFVLAGSGGSPQSSRETILRIKVPRELSDAAAGRSGQKALAKLPVLILEGVEIGDGEGVSFKVLSGTARDASHDRVILAEAGTVGQPQKTLKEPLQKINLTVPLNDKSLSLIAGQKEVTLGLRIMDSQGRPALKVARAYFTTSNTKF